MKELKTTHENALLQSQLEIQEQTFQNISQEIHDNIGQKLTLAKLHLNTLNMEDPISALQQIQDSVKMIGETINDLSDISRSLSSEIILNNGFIKALEFEVNQLNKTRLYNIKLSVTGDSIFMEAQKELLLFRIVQEALNNIVKHAEATQIHIRLHYCSSELVLEICDNGIGMVEGAQIKRGNGFANMSRRASMLQGLCHVISEPKEGTTIKIEIPLYEKQQEI